MCSCKPVSPHHTSSQIFGHDSRAVHVAATCSESARISQASFGGCFEIWDSSAGIVKHPRWARRPQLARARAPRLLFCFQPRPHVSVKFCCSGDIICGHFKCTSRKKQFASLKWPVCKLLFVSIRYVRAVGERLVATRLAPYLADVLLVLDFNEFFEKKD